MKRKQIIFLLAVCTMLFGVYPMEANAAEISELQTQTEGVAGDGYEIVESHDTAKSAETSCFLSVETICPEGFGLNTYVMLMDELSNSYRVSISAENWYVGQIYLAPGKYQVTEVSVFDDYKQEYPFIITEREITLSENENRTISFTMRDYEKIQKEIADRTNAELKDKDTQDVIFSDTQIYKTWIEGVYMQ